MFDELHMLQIQTEQWYSVSLYIKMATVAKWHYLMYFLDTMLFFSYCAIVQ